MLGGQRLPWPCGLMSKLGRPPFKAEVILRVLCRPRGTTSWGRSTGVAAAEAPPGLGFYSVPESPRPAGQGSECGRWTLEEEAEGVMI